MHLLLTNDDGVHAKGLREISKTLGRSYVTTVVAPRIEQSAKSHSFTMWDTIELQKHNSQEFSVSGTPVDCVYIGLNHIVKSVTAVVSGINHGLNLGSDTHYSGTVAAAREACLSDTLGIAISTERSVTDWAKITTYAQAIIEKLLKAGLTKGIYYNLNIPDFKEFPSIKVCSLGERHYKKVVDKRLDPRGRSYFWIGGPPIESPEQPGTDVFWFEKGFATLTPMKLDVTATEELEKLEMILCPKD